MSFVFVAISVDFPPRAGGPKYPQSGAKLPKTKSVSEVTDYAMPDVA